MNRNPETTHQHEEADLKARVKAAEHLGWPSALIDIVKSEGNYKVYIEGAKDPLFVNGADAGASASSREWAFLRLEGSKPDSGHEWVSVRISNIAAIERLPPANAEPLKAFRIKI